MTRLSLAALPSPLSFDRAKVRAGIVHLGIGAFHRAHMAAYVDQLLAIDPQWGIVGVSLRSPNVRAALAPQDGLYTLLTVSAQQTSARIIGSVVNVLDVNEQASEVMRWLTSPDIRIVSLTVTEKGYCHSPATGRLDRTHPDIVHDLAHPDAPRSAPGWIVRALELRRERGIAPFTVLSCDNLPANGSTTGRIVAELASMRSPQLGQWVGADVAFPSAMVDRIVPATTDADRTLAASLTGRDDAWPIVTEPFTQWVIEDRFPAGRPKFEAIGVEMVEDVAAYELMKLRLLNGSHSTLAYLGYLAGCEFVSDAVAQPVLRRLIADLMTQEVIPTLPLPRPALEAYRDRLLDRFANTALKHRTWQIAMDGSQKLPQRLLGTIRSRLAAGQPFERLSLGVAAWMRYVMGVDELDVPIDVRDPLLPRLREAIGDGADAPRIVGGLLSIPDIFGLDLARNSRFRASLESKLDSLITRGALATAAQIAD